MHPATSEDDRVGGGERFALLSYNLLTRRWEGRLNTPVPRRGRLWRVAVKSWLIPPLIVKSRSILPLNLYKCSLCVRLVEPHADDPVLMVDHNKHGHAPRLVWYPLADDIKDISDIHAVISSSCCDGFRPSSASLHLVLDFATDDDNEDVG